MARPCGLPIQRSVLQFGKQSTCHRNISQILSQPSWPHSISHLRGGLQKWTRRSSRPGVGSERPLGFSQSGIPLIHSHSLTFGVLHINANSLALGGMEFRTDLLILR